MVVLLTKAMLSTMALSTAMLSAALLPTAAHSQEPRAIEPKRDASRWATPRLLAGIGGEQAYLWQLSEHLAGTGSPRELALAAHVRAMAGVRDVRIVGGLRLSDAATQRWLLAAERLGARDAVVQILLRYRFSAADRTNRRAQALQRWRDRDRDNLAPLLAAASEDAALSPETILALAQGAVRAEFYFDDILRPMIWAARVQPPPLAVLDGAADSPEAFGARLGTTVWSVVNDTGFAGLTAACIGPALNAEPQRRMQCRHVARLLAEESDTLAARGIGVRLRLHSETEEAPLRTAAVAYRRHHWQQQQWQTLQQREPQRYAREFARRLADDARSTEIDTVARLLAGASVPLDPPADWIAPEPR